MNLNRHTCRLPAIALVILTWFHTTFSAVVGQDTAGEASAALVENPTRKPNVLFIAVDDLRPTLGCYGDKVAISPNIDRLAAKGTRFQHAYCQVAVCNPSRASLMTGLRPDTLGVWTLSIHFREAKPDAITLPQWFRRFGYTAVSHGKIYHNPTPDPQSWSEPIRSLPRLPYFYPDGTRELILREQAKLPPGDWRKNNLRGPATAAPELPDNQLLDGARTDLCIEDLRRLAKDDQPFFLAMGYIRPHLSFVAPRKYWDLYDADVLPLATQQNTPDGSPRFAMHNNSELSHYVDMINTPTPWDDTEVPEAKSRQLLHGYYACVSYVDAQIGRLLDALEQAAIAENTIVVLWSDHGYKLGEYRGWGKMTNYEIDARVPLIMVAPHLPASEGQSTQALAELLDVYPTLCDLAQIPIPEFAEGQSLLPVLRDSNARVREGAVNQYYRKVDGNEYMGYALRTEDYRYVEWRDFSTGETVDRELYDHRHEPESHLGIPESKNMIQETPGLVIQRLSGMLRATHPPKQLDLRPAVHTSPSGPGRLPVQLTLQNDYDGAVTVYPIQPSGRRAMGRNLSPGDKVAYRARLGGVFVVESKDGRIHQIHSPRWPSKPIHITAE